jgi:hypothetical protein
MILLLIAFISLFFAEAQHAFSITGAGIDSVNGVYVCEKPGSCYSIVDDHRYFLSIVHKMTSSGAQRRWYIADTRQKTVQGKGLINLYGAIEISEVPWAVGMWKRLSSTGGASVEEPSLRAEDLSLRCDQQRALPESTEKMLQRLQAGTASIYITNSDTISSSEVSLANKVATATCVRALLRLPTLPSRGTGNTSCCADEMRGLMKLLQTKDSHMLPQEHMLPLCEWAAAVGSWDVARSCFSHNLFHESDSVSDGPVAVEEFASKQSHYLKRYALLSLALDLNTTSVSRAYETWLKSDVVTDTKEADDEHYWTALHGISGVFSSATIPLVSDVKTHEVCQLLQSAATSHDRSASAATLVQVCHYIKHGRATGESGTVWRVPLYSAHNEIHYSNEAIPLSTDQVSALVVSLLGVGATEEVGSLVCSSVAHSLYIAFSPDDISENEELYKEDLHVEYMQLLQYCNTGSIPLEDIWARLGPVAQDAVREIWSKEHDINEVSSMFISSHMPVAIAEAVKLHGLVQQIAAGPGMPKPWQYLRTLMHSDRMGFVLEHSEENVVALLVSTMLQLASPLVLRDALLYSCKSTRVDNITETVCGNARGNSLSTDEALLLRILAVDTLTTINERICNVDGTGIGLGISCVIRDPVSSIGVRGLFLLAYQGITVPSASEPTATPQLVDAAIPLHYRTLMQSTQLHWPWMYSPPIKSQEVNTIRVAFVSPFFFKHSVGRLLGNVIKGLSGQGISQDHNSHSNKNKVQLDIHIVDMRFNRMETNDDEISQYLRLSVPKKNWHAPALSTASASSMHRDGSGDNDYILSSNPADCVQYLRSQNFDIVIFGDNYMDSVLGHVMLMRVAPVVAAFWGHPFTTGYSDTIDYFITGDYYEPNDHEAQHSRHHAYEEQLVRFQSLSFLMFDLNPVLRVSDAIKNVETLVIKDIWGQPAPSYLFDASKFYHHHSTHSSIHEHHYYSSLQSLMKMHPLFDHSLVGILLQDKKAIILLLENKKQPLWQQRWISRIRSLIHEMLLDTTNIPQSNGKFHEAIIDIESRIFFAPQMSHDKYRSLLCSLGSSHVILDPYPFGGGVTVVDGLSCTEQEHEELYDSIIPPVVVTSGGLQTVHRLGNGIMRTLGEAVHQSAESMVFSEVYQCCNTINRHDPNQSRNCVTDDKGYLTGVIISPTYNTTEQIHQYVNAAVCIGIMASTRPHLHSTSHSIDIVAHENHHHHPQSHSDKVKKHVLFGKKEELSTETDAHEAVQEWKEFLLRIA